MCCKALSSFLSMSPSVSLSAISIFMLARLSIADVCSSTDGTSASSILPCACGEKDCDDSNPVCDVHADRSKLICSKETRACRTDPRCSTPGWSCQTGVCAFDGSCSSYLHSFSCPLDKCVWSSAGVAGWCLEKAPTPQPPTFAPTPQPPTFAPTPQPPTAAPAPTPTATATFHAIGDMSGAHMNSYSGVVAVQHTTEPNLYIFAVFDDGHTKMVGYTIVAGSSKPVRVDGRAILNADRTGSAADLSAAWDEKWSGGGTPESSYGVYNIVVTAAPSKRPCRRLQNSKKSEGSFRRLGAKRSTDGSTDYVAPSSQRSGSSGSTTDGSTDSAIDACEDAEDESYALYGGVAVLTCLACCICGTCKFLYKKCCKSK